MWNLSATTLAGGAQLLLETHEAGQVSFAEQIQAVTRSCQIDRSFGSRGTLELPSADTSPSYQSMLALHDGNVLLLGASAEAGAWVLEELSADGVPVPSFGHVGIARIRSRGAAVALLAGVELPDGDVALGGTVGLRTEHSQVIEIDAHGAQLTDFGRSGVADVLPPRNGISQLLALPDGSLMAVAGTSPSVDSSAGRFWLTALSSGGRPLAALTHRLDADVRAQAMTAGFAFPQSGDGLILVGSRASHCAAWSTWCTAALEVNRNGVVLPHSEAIVFSTKNATSDGYDLGATEVGDRVLIGEVPQELHDPMTYVLREYHPALGPDGRFGVDGAIAFRLPDEEAWDTWTLLPILAMRGPDGDAEAVIPEPYGIRLAQIRT
jgi:hypothetical protein